MSASVMVAGPVVAVKTPCSHGDDTPHLSINRGTVGVRGAGASQTLAPGLSHSRDAAWHCGTLGGRTPRDVADMPGWGVRRPDRKDRPAGRGALVDFEFWTFVDESLRKGARTGQAERGFCARRAKRPRRDQLETAAHFVAGDHSPEIRAAGNW
ncbi:hypothetical protein SKAU_G00339760 [Synaphobranchus kaupii]|uniref:Uncharacterized protein n=1 Tax=Synaphobranchus kaupii TaxID=118154 RepID=A0A9Q1IIE3_SYNKA|nr:hypothetical protein SKAU_G00339760 [Synaphobranchus kaupii]